METSAIITAIDEEIAQLRQVRDLLAGGVDSRSIRPTVKRRVLSPEARKRIVDAQRRRWAAQKKADKKA